jgi:hypothetical protein
MEAKTMMIENTLNALTVLQAMLRGYVVEILGDKYAYDTESRQIGVLKKDGNENFIIFAEIGLNRFLSMCEQVDPKKIHEIQAVLNYSGIEPQLAPAVEVKHFH